MPISYRENLRVAKSMAVRISSFIGDEHAISIRDEMNEVEPSITLLFGQQRRK
jgi:hypothetical protein